MKLMEWKMLKSKFTTKLVDKIDLIKLIDKKKKKEKLKQLIWQSEIDKMKLIIEIDNTILKVGNW